MLLLMMKQSCVGQVHATVLPSFAALGLILLATRGAAAQSPIAAPKPPAAREYFPPALIEQGQALFQRDCAFCHGRDAAGGETGSDLTRSKLAVQDVNGDKIIPVIKNGRPDKGMPPFNLSEQELSGLVAFIHNQKTKADTQKGGRRGVDAADLQTGNAESGKRYFNGAGTCSSCHSATGDLAGIATRFQGLQLEERMLYPKGAKAKITVTLPGGQTLTGILAYQDEFTVALRDADGRYRSWFASDVRYSIDAPAEAHVELLGKYSDADIHNLMAYLQTLR